MSRRSMPVSERFQNCCVPMSVEQAFRPAIKLLKKSALATEVKLWGYTNFKILIAFFLAATVGQFSAGAQTTPVTADPLNTPLIGAAPATPSATFTAPAPTAGISNAGRAGISNSAPLPTTLPSLSNTVVYVTQPPVETVITGVPATNAENTANNPGASSEVAPGNNESGGRTVNDMGPSYYADALPGSDNGSLGELSAHYKALKGTMNARMLTNDDVQQMVANKDGVTVAKNMPPLGPGALVQSGQSQPAGSQSAPQNAQSTQQQQNAANGQGGTPPPSPSSKDQSATNGVSAENSTTPQINQQQSNDAQGSRRLPATATILPLLGLLGLVSGGIGFWFRKFRK